MLKKRISLLLAVVLVAALFSGCCLSHEWVEATCETPRTCAKCDKTEGAPLGHAWVDATCETPKTCFVCSKTEGTPLDHAWTEATCETAKTCTLCGATEGEALGHSVAWKQKDATTMEGTCDVCGEFTSEALDWNKVGPTHIVGDWDGTKGKTQQTDGFVNLPSGTTLNLYADGTGKLTMSGTTFDMTWNFDRAVEQEDYDNVYTMVYDYYVDGTGYQMMITEGLGGTAYLFVYVGDTILVFE